MVRALTEPVGLTLDRDVVVHDFAEHGRQMVRLAVLLPGDRGLAEEAVQEAFVAVYRNWDGVRDKASLAGYVRAAVVNRCRSAQRGLVRARRLRDRMGSFREGDGSGRQRRRVRRGVAHRGARARSAAAPARGRRVPLLPRT